MDEQLDARYVARVVGGQNQEGLRDFHPRCRDGQLHLSKLRMTFLFGETFSTFADLLKYQFKLLQFF